MYSVKPGRGPSLLQAFALIVFLVPFGLFFGTTAMKAGAPALFGYVGFAMAGFGVVAALYNIFAATTKHRPSMVDITRGGEEGDAVARMLGHEEAVAGPVAQRKETPRAIPGDFCPYCGEAASPDHDYCPYCGKDI